MTAPRKLAAFGVAVLAAFALGWAVGDGADPVLDDPSHPAPTAEHSEHPS